MATSFQDNLFFFSQFVSQPFVKGKTSPGNSAKKQDSLISGAFVE